MQGSCLVLLAVLSVAAGQMVQLNLEFEFFNKFGNIKARQACFGMEPTMQYHAEVDAAVTKCFAKYRAPEIANFNAPQTLFTLFRKKRDARYPSERVSHLAKEIQIEADYFRCVMQEIGINDANNHIDEAGLVTKIKSQGLNKELEHDLVHAVVECRKFVECIPPGKDGYPVPEDTVATKHFVYCEKQLRTLACMKYDARWLLDDFDLRGTDNRLDFIESDQDKVTALLFANNVVGPDDFGLYE